MKNNIKIELVPDGCMGISLKNGLKPTDWNKLRKIAYKNSDGKCACCGKELYNKFEAHEVWSYNLKNKTRKLDNIIAICSLCHKGIHLNRSYLCEDIKRVEDNFMAVNEMSYSEMKNQLKIANETQKELSKIYDWQLDLTILEDFIK